MAVRKREYNDEYGRPVWGYDFSFRRERYRNAGHMTKDEALIAEAEARRKAVEGQRPILPKSFEAVVQAFLENRRTYKAANTADREKRRANVIMKQFGDKMLARITTRDIDAYVRLRQSQGMAPRSINLEITFLRSLFKFSVTRRYAHENPAQHIQFVPCPEKERQIPTDEEYGKLLQFASIREAGRELVTWLQLMAYTGMRTSETLFLEWADIDYNNDRITIKPKLGNPIKNKQFRIVNIHPELKPILQEWQVFWNETFKASKPHDWVFFHPRQIDKRAKGFRTALCKAMKKAGITSFTPHIMRHYFASKAVMAGVPYGVIMKWLGHSSTRMIDKVYGHFYSDFSAHEMTKIKIGTIKATPESCHPAQSIAS